MDRVVEAPAYLPANAAVAPLRRLRVLFVNDTARNGGPGRSLHSILKFLDPIVVHRAVVLPRDGPIAQLLSGDRCVDELHFVNDLVENPIEPWGRAMERSDFDATAALKGARFAGNIFKGARALATLTSLVRKNRFDLVYCNGSSADFAGGAVAAMTGVPALWHVRYTSVPSMVSAFHRRLSASKGVRRIVCVSHAAAGLFAHCSHKVTVIHNALDVDKFDPANVRGTLRAELGLPADTVIFGSHGRVLRRKGFVEMIRAARVALDRMSIAEQARIAFVVVGDTPEDFRPDHVVECRALAVELGISDRFHMLGFRSDVRPIVADFDVAVLPSVYADPLPRAAIESMALCKPVIAFDVGGIAEMVDDGITGALVHFDAASTETEGANDATVERLAETILRYSRGASMRASQGRAGRQRVERDFDAHAHAQRIQNEIVLASGVSGTTAFSHPS